MITECSVNGFWPGNFMVPQDREGTFSTPVFSRYQRNEKALVLALVEIRASVTWTWRNCQSIGAWRSEKPRMRCS
jgi:hypothetical protein